MKMYLIQIEMEIAAPSEKNALKQLGDHLLSLSVDINTECHLDGGFIKVYESNESINTH